MHGAGTRKRLTEPAPDGELRRDPREAGAIAGVKLGRYMQKTGTRFREAMAEFRAAKEELFDQETIQARLWALLLTVDEVEAAFDLRQLADMRDGGPSQLCECGELLRRAECARDMLNRIYACRSILHELLEGVRVRNKVDERASGLVTETQMVAILAMLMNRLGDIVRDPAVSRDQIVPTLAQWIEAQGRAQSGAPT